MDYNICELIHTATWRENTIRWIISAENRLFVIIVIGLFPGGVTGSQVGQGGASDPQKTDPSKYRQNFEITTHPNTSMS